MKGTLHYRRISCLIKANVKLKSRYTQNNGSFLSLRLLAIPLWKIECNHPLLLLGENDNKYNWKRQPFQSIVILKGYHLVI